MAFTTGSMSTSNIPHSQLDFSQLVHRLDPNPDILSGPWKTAYDHVARVVLLYQLDVRASVPCIRKAVRIQCSANQCSSRNGSADDGPLPTVFLHNRAQPSDYVHNVLGRRTLESFHQLAELLDQVNAEDDHRAAPVVESLFENPVRQRLPISSGLPATLPYDVEANPPPADRSLARINLDATPLNASFDTDAGDEDDAVHHDQQSDAGGENADVSTSSSSVVAKSTKLHQTTNLACQKAHREQQSVPRAELTSEQQLLLHKIKRSLRTPCVGREELWPGGRIHVDARLLGELRDKLDSSPPLNVAVRLAVICFGSTDVVLEIITGNRFGLQSALGVKTVQAVCDWTNNVHHHVLNKTAKPVTASLLCQRFSKNITRVRNRLKKGAKESDDEY